MDRQKAEKYYNDTYFYLEKISDNEYKLWRTFNKVEIENGKIKCISYTHNDTDKVFEFDVNEFNKIVITVHELKRVLVELI